MLRLHHGNCLADLADVLFEQLRAAPGGPLQPQCVVVPNPGTGRWLAQGLAERSGVAANLDLPLPAAFFWRVLRAWLPQARVSPFDRDTLLWRILAELPGLLQRPAFAEPARYAEDPLRLYQLAGRIADLFDQYLVFRPDMVLAWERGEGDDWQAELWRAITARDDRHRARLLNQLAEAMQAPPPDGHDLPPRLFFFGLNALPPVYLDLLDRLARHFDVVLFHLNPSREYWADIRSERTVARRARAFAGRDDPFAPFLDLGNPLLASLGHVGQVFLDQLLQLEGASHDHFRAAGGDGLLARLQDDILMLRDGREAPRPPPNEAFPSIQVHGTHGRWREVQVLHDNLLRCFQALPGLEARDILVMAPDMAAYAPLVEAVFGTAPPERHIPWTLADRPAGGELPLAGALRWLLQLPQARCGASEILALLEVPAVQRRFGLEEEALERVRQWVGEAAIRWGLDGDQRQSLGLPDDEVNTWAFGLRRLFLGLTLPVEQAPPLLEDCLPCLEVEGGELPWLGALQSLVDALRRWRARLGQAATPGEWQRRIQSLLDTFFEPADEAEGQLLDALRDRLDELVERATTAGFEAPLAPEVLRRLLEEALDNPQGARGFLQGGVTFSNLLPMRALPFRVICLLGMNHADFPRAQPRLSFDLIAADPQRGDRDRRRDDRYLFLETLLAAGDCLLISYQSRDPRSDQPCRPAGPVSELIDYLAASHAEPLELFVQHPLQPFSPRALDPQSPATWTFDADWRLAGEPPGPFLAQPLPEPEGERVVDLETLVDFWRDPAGFFLKQRLQLRLPRDEEEPQDEEPFVPAGLEWWQLRRQALDDLLAGQDPERVGARLRAAGLLPHGQAGARTLAGLLEEVAPFAEQVVTLRESLAPPLALDLEIDGWRLQGEIGRWDGRGLLDWRVGKTRAEHRLALWIRHLALCAAREDVAEARFLASEDGGLTLPPLDPDVACEHLAVLLGWYAEGLRTPLPFFPRATWAWITNNKKDYDDQAMKVLDERTNRLAFRDRDPLADPRFTELAKAVYGPLLVHLEKDE